MNEYTNSSITYRDIVEWKSDLRMCKDDLNSRDTDLTICTKRLYHDMCFLVSFVESLLQFEYADSVNERANELQKEVK